MRRRRIGKKMHRSNSDLLPRHADHPDSSPWHLCFFLFRYHSCNLGEWTPICVECKCMFKRLQKVDQGVRWKRWIFLMRLDYLLYIVEEILQILTVNSYGSHILGICIHRRKTYRSITSSPSSIQSLKRLVGWTNHHPLLTRWKVGALSQTVFIYGVLTCILYWFPLFFPFCFKRELTLSEVARPQGGAGRGKDMANIIEAQKQRDEGTPRSVFFFFFNIFEMSPCCSNCTAVVWGYPLKRFSY